MPYYLITRSSIRELVTGIKELEETQGQELTVMLASEEVTYSIHNEILSVYTKERHDRVDSVIFGLEPLMSEELQQVFEGGIPYIPVDGSRVPGVQIVRQWVTEEDFMGIEWHPIKPMVDI